MEFEEVTIKGETFRIRKERSFKASCSIEKKQRTKDFGIDDIVKAEVGIFDRRIKEWRKITDDDLEEMSSNDGYELFQKIMQVRKANKDFQKTPTVSEKKSETKQKPKSGK